MPLTGPHPASGTVAELLCEIRELLHEFDEGEKRTPASKSVPAARAPRRAADPASHHALAILDPLLSATPRRRYGIVVAALAVGGTAVLGTAGLVSASRLSVVSTAGKGQAAVRNQPKVMARAALPPAPAVAAASGDFMTGSSAGTRDEARSPVYYRAGRSTPPPALAEQASKFIDSYWEQSSASEDKALRYLGSIYAPVVNYYGQPRTRDSVLRDKHAFVRRWPMRQTWPMFEAANATVSCDRAKAECDITGLRGFATENPKRSARSTGVVRYAYKVRFSDGTAQIVAESSKIVPAISAPAASPPR